MKYFIKNFQIICQNIIVFSFGFIFLFNSNIISTVYGCETGGPSPGDMSWHYDVKAAPNDTCIFGFIYGYNTVEIFDQKITQSDGLSYQKYERKAEQKENTSYGYIVRTKEPGHYVFRWQLTSRWSNNKVTTQENVYNITVDEKYSKSNFAQNNSSRSNRSSNGGETSQGQNNSEDNSETTGQDSNSLKKYNDGFKFYEKHDYASALNIWLPLADKGLPIAQDAVGGMYFKGEGVAVNQAKGIELIKLAAASGLLKSQSSLALFFETIDIEQSAKWHSMAAHQGDIRSQYKYAYFLDQGFTDRPAIIEAYVWASLSNKAGYSDARRLLSAIIDKLSGNDLVVAQKLLEQCSKTKFKNCSTTASDPVIKKQPQ